MTQAHTLQDRIEIQVAGGLVKYIDLTRHADGSITATAPVADFTLTRFYFHLYNRFVARAPRPAAIVKSDDGLLWIAAIPAPATAELRMEIDRFRRAFARWKAAFPYLTDQKRKIERLVDRYGDTPAALRMYRRLNAWLGGKFTFDAGTTR